MGAQGGNEMTQNDQIQAIINQAKHRRAEVLASAFGNQWLPVALVAVLSMMLVHFDGSTNDAASRSVELATVNAAPLSAGR